MDLTNDDIQFANKYARVVCGNWGSLPSDEFQDVVTDALVKAAFDFDPNRSTDFRKFAGYVIRNRMVDYLRDKLGRYPNNYKEFIRPVDFSDNSLQLSADGLESRVIAKDIIYKLKSFLSETQRRRLDLRLIGMTNREIADMDNVSYQEIDLTFWRINKKIEKFKREILSTQENQKN